jgi:cell pole-organizing protein PopZ
MDLNNKNGQPSMEEILASIRRIIAEEPTAANPVIDLNAKYRNKPDDHEEGNDFELPSIFRPAAPAPERQPLFGRLTDAIRNASGSEQKAARKGDETDSQERYRGALRDSGMILAVSNGNGGLDNVHGSSQNGEGSADRYRGALRDAGGNGSLSSALSSLKLARGGDSVPLAAREADTVQAASLPPAAAPQPPVTEPPLTSTPVASMSAPEDVRRVMVPFRDRRMAGMSAPLSGAVPDQPVAEYRPPSEPTPIHHVAEFPVPSPQDVFSASIPPPPQPQFQSAPASPSFDEASLSLDDMHRFAPVVDHASRPPPPPPAPVAAAATGIEDTTADLLRPMLRQWLAENMPRMVEKALSIELAESVKSSRKFNGN